MESWTLAEAIELFSPHVRGDRPWRVRPTTASQFNWGRYRCPEVQAEHELANRPQVFALARAVTLDPPRPSGCQWIVVAASRPGEAPLFCSEPVSRGAFCACHARLAYVGVAP